MKILLLGKNAQNIEASIKKLGFEIVTENPDVILSYGGDGTLLSAERQYPGIPKLPIRNSKICKKCSSHEDEVVLKKVFEREVQPVEHRKLETEILYKKFYALNDFVVRNLSPVHTIRFKASPTGNKLLIGDGVVVATPFGSTGYFKSITHQTFDSGFGVAFNNTTQQMPPVILKDQDILIFDLIRGKATLSFDNSPEIFNIDEGSELVFKLSHKVAKIYEGTSLRCPNCQVIRG